MLNLCGTWVAALIFLVFVLQYCEKRAALRGTNRAPLQKWQDKSLRTIFLFVFVSPLMIGFGWWGILLFFLYLPTYLDGSEVTGARASDRLKNFIVWRYFYHRLGLKLVVEEKLDENQQYIMGISPHGILPWGAAVNLRSNFTNVDEHLGKIRSNILAASMCFYVPLYRDLLLAGGAIDAARYNAIRALKEGHSLMLVPGGATEALYSAPRTNTLHLKSRSGFIKLALETGAHLVPVYSFNEVDAYGVVSEDHEYVMKAKKKFQAVFGISLPLITNIIPRKVEITTVVGKPIEVEQIHNPTKEQVEAVLDKYIAELTRVFNDHHEKCGTENNLVVY
ncbi:hypothetical protein SARC_04958 [Sphaeroforma arctica JP610]|uniref:Acyltransferase n=1 Tax=Sphaeroforma arctica JP610 TaxID=667725 RepID=A0A0L0G3I2_9EUKA|nr:hypothetical protein SARC_04958 [Sphaeroforma arctica JP610]KNC82758.1 hypothetical protein SARC_04958 [Sphaeroforma arctica JP610]|eukprot:XP_014156660.1 hypothetical protein SARC_04958 [Sphaeroforma arctica JP610]